MSSVPNTVNESLAIIARRAIRTPPDGWPLKPGWCQMFVRLCIQSLYGRKYNAIFSDSAKSTAEEWRLHGYGFAPTSATEYRQGDILYKEGGTYGHVGIWVGRVNGSDVPLVAENSSTSLGRVNGALGYRTIGQFRQVDWVVRLSPPVGQDVA